MPGLPVAHDLIRITQGLQSSINCWPSIYSSAVGCFCFICAICAINGNMYIMQLKKDAQEGVLTIKK